VIPVDDDATGCWPRGESDDVGGAGRSCYWERPRGECDYVSVSSSRPTPLIALLLALGLGTTVLSVGPSCY
jgi:hypothetical protein